MKKYFFLIICAILISAATPLWGQQYQRIYSDSTTYWTLRHGVTDHYYSATEKMLQLKGDTLINFQVYKIARMKTSSWPADTNYSYVPGYFREDSTSTRAWFRGRFDTTEILIMDLSLEVGDTVSFPEGWCSPSLGTVISVDTINGRKEIAFDKNCFHSPPSKRLKFIEGVGPNYALFYLMQNRLNWEELNCFAIPISPCIFPPYRVCQVFHGDTIVYTQNPNFSDGCDNDWVSIDKHPPSQSLSLFPNPGTNTLNIEGLNAVPSSPTLTIEIFDMMGRKINSTKVQTSPLVTLDMEDIAPGILLVRVLSDERQVLAVRRWVKR